MDISAIKDAIKEQITPALDEMRQIKKDVGTKVEEAIDIRKELMSHMERGTKANDPKVQDLEAKLADALESLSDTREAVRLMQTEVSARGKEDEKAEVDYGVLEIIKNEKELRGLLNKYGSFDGAMANQERIIDLATLNSGGALTAQQQNTFMDFMMNLNNTLSRVGQEPMSSPVKNMDELIVAQRKVRARGAAGSALAVADSVSTSQRVLTSVETAWTEDIDIKFVEDNIERGGINAHIIRRLSQAFGNDHNDLFWNSDTAAGAGADQLFLNVNDGIIKIAKADAGVIDYSAASDTTVQDILANTLKATPYEMVMNPLLKYEYTLPYKTALTYAQEMVDRGTVWADQVLRDGWQGLTYFGYPIYAEPHLNLGAADEAVFTPRSNLKWGVQRGVRVEVEWRPRNLIWQVTIHARTDHNYAKSRAVTLVDGIPAALR
jgi:hypothetical protein